VKRCFTVGTPLDNVIYRLGFASSRSQARQLVRHNHIQSTDAVSIFLPFSYGSAIPFQINEKSVNCLQFWNRCSFDGLWVVMPG
jgi:hypothetical protein